MFSESFNKISETNKVNKISETNKVNFTSIPS